MPDLFMSPQVFAIFSTLIEEKTGIHYRVEDIELLRNKLTARAVESGFDSLLDYYYLLRYDDHDRRELDLLIDAIVVPETYFFREFDALKLAVSDFVKPLLGGARRPRLWCAACATGEEPLTVAMLLASEGLLGSVDIVASDMSQRVLSRAAAGQFGLRALRRIPDEDLAGRFILREDNTVRVSPEISRSIDWRRVNLIDRTAVEALGAFDVVLCRNVLIYFRDETATQVASTLASVLNPGGVLFVGVSESLLRLSSALVCEERRGTFYYRRSS